MKYGVYKELKKKMPFFFKKLQTEDITEKQVGLGKVFMFVALAVSC